MLKKNIFSFYKMLSIDQNVCTPILRATMQPENDSEFIVL